VRAHRGFLVAAADAQRGRGSHALLQVREMQAHLEGVRVRFFSREKSQGKERHKGGTNDKEKERI